MRRARLLLGSAVLLAASAAADDSCSMDWICVETQESRDAILLFARNLQPWPVALSIGVETDNLWADPLSEVTRSLAGHERVQLVRLERADPGRRWRYRYRFDWTVGSTHARHDDSYLYALPYGAGESYGVLQGFGASFSHTGLEEYTVDFDMAEGTPVHAARGGVVVRVQASHDRACWDPGCGRYANFIVVLHDDDTTGEYYHLMHDGARVRVGQRVARGELIGYSGNTGKSTMPHLHFGVYRAVEWGRTQSVAIRFVTDQGVIERPRSGRRYRRP
jgi:murein DD-endopeptidase MepM/ murein hydrolase activator NlpD